MKSILLNIVFGIISFFSLVVYSQDINHWESVVLNTSDSKYFVGTTAPDLNWQLLSFNDSTWLDGKASVGFGDGDDLVDIGSGISVYLRVKFDIADLSKISAAVFHIDYDDSFVAYLNGNEIARSNIGVVGTEPLYNATALSDHEAVLYSGGTPESFLLSNENFALLKQGTNVLSVQVHNKSNISSDMTCMPFLSLGIADDSISYLNTPLWFEAPFLNFTSSKLPILIIDTEGGVAIQDEPKVNASLKIVYNESGAINYVEGPYHESSGPIGIELRGNSTQDLFPKKPYLFETRDSVGNNRNVKILGLPAENDWILRACYLDKTLMRNAIACQMSRNMGRYASRVKFCEIVINGSYDGVYLLMEKIKADKNRVDIEELDSLTIDVDSIKGGYIYEVSQSIADMGNRRNLRYPDPDWANTNQYNYIINYDDTFRALMEQSNYADAKTGYPIMIDVQSFIDEIIVQEATKNSDAYGWSSYFHKKRHQKLAAGPVWDFDQALCNSTWNDGDVIGEWNITKPITSVPLFWSKLFNEPTFKYLFKKRWFELRSSVLHTDTLVSMIDGFAQQLDGAQQRNYTRWPILGVELWRSLPGWDQRNTYEKEVDYMKTWFVNHLNWMDQQLAVVPDVVIPTPNLVISEINYSSFNGPEREYLKVENAGITVVDLTGVFFSDGIEYSFNTGETLQPGDAVYLASDTVAFKTRFGEPANGIYYGQLDNKGEKIELANSYGVTIDKVVYSDTLPWPVADEAHPGAIRLTDVMADNSLAVNWEFVESIIDVPSLVISEIMYDPGEGSDYEFVEIANISEDDVDMTGVFLSDAINYSFPDGYIVKAGDLIVVASSNLRFSSKYGFSVIGDFSGKLDNAGERIVLQNIAGGIIDVVEYDNAQPWPVIDPLFPTSIELTNLFADNSRGENWRLSSLINGSPMYNTNTGIDVMSDDFQLTVFPNPANDFININGSFGYDDNVLVEIIDMMGVKQNSIKVINRINSCIRLDVSSLVKGYYLVRLTNKSIHKTKKILINR
ncbi:MAG: CotH kinase family protein [Bacteroidales bacterium]|nr:CotH kinase family protein [Bacteroidales bacterium]